MCGRRGRRPGLGPASPRTTRWRGWELRSGSSCVSWNVLSTGGGSGSRFENHVERRLGGAAEFREAAAPHDILQVAFARLRAEARGAFLRARGGRADEGRGG